MSESYNLYPTPYGGSGYGGGAPTLGGGINIPGFGFMGNAIANTVLNVAAPNVGAFFSSQSNLERMIGASYRQQLNTAMGLNSNPLAILQEFRRADGTYDPGLVKSKFGGMSQGQKAQLYAAASSVGPAWLSQGLSMMKGTGQYAMAEGVLQGMGYMAGASRWPTDNAGIRALGFASQFQDAQGNWSLNMMPKQAGQLYTEMTKRGMIPGRVTDMAAGGSSRIKETFKSWEKTIDGLSDIFGKDLVQLMAKLDKITGGQMQGASPMRMAGLLNKMKSFQFATNASNEMVENMAMQGASLAQSMGLSNIVGVNATFDSANMANQMTRMISVGGAGGTFAAVSTRGRADLDVRRKLVEQKSRASVMAGGLLSIVSERAQQAGFSGAFGRMSGSLGRMGGSRELINLVRRLENNDASAIAELGSMGSDALNAMGASIGVSGAEMYSRLTTESPYQQEMSSALQGALRGASTSELIGSIATKVSGQVGVSQGIVKGALLGMQNIKSLDPRSATRYLRGYLQQAGVANADEAAKQIYSATKLDAGTRFASLGGFDQIFMDKRAQAAAAVGDSAYAKLQSIDDQIETRFGSKGMARAVIDILGSPDKDPREVIKGLSKAGASVFKEISPMLGNYQDLVRKALQNPGNTQYSDLAKEQAGYINQALKENLSIKDQGAIARNAGGAASPGAASTVQRMDVTLLDAKGTKIRYESGKKDTTVVKRDASSGERVGEEYEVVNSSGVSN